MKKIAQSGHPKWDSTSFHISRYIAPEAAAEISLPAEIRQSVVSGICSETGKVDPGSFDDAYEIIKSEMETQHFPSFLRSKIFNQYLASWAFILWVQEKCTRVKTVEKYHLVSKQKYIFPSCQMYIKIVGINFFNDNC